MSNRAMSFHEDHDTKSNSSIPMDHFLYEALQGTKDRLFVLKTEYQIEKFMKNQNETQMSFPELNSYHRLMVHRVAQYFQLIHLPDNTKTGVILYKCAASQVPLLKLSDFIETEESPEATKPTTRLKIMKRNTGPTSQTTSNLNAVPSSVTLSPCVSSSGTTDMASQTAASTSPFPSSSSSSSTAAAAEGEPSSVSGRKEFKSREEREVDYLKARARIFGDFDESKPVVPASTSTSTSTSTSQSSSFTPVEDSSHSVEYLTVSQLAMSSDQLDPDAQLTAESLIQEGFQQPSQQSIAQAQSARPMSHFYPLYYPPHPHLYHHPQGTKATWQSTWSTPSFAPTIPASTPLYYPPYHGQYPYYRPVPPTPYYPYPNPPSQIHAQSSTTPHLVSYDWPSLSSNVKSMEPSKSSGNNADLAPQLTKMSISSTQSENESQSDRSIADLTCAHILEVSFTISETSSVSSTIESLLNVYKSSVKKYFLSPLSSTSSPDDMRTLVVVFKNAKAAEKAKTEWSPIVKRVVFWRRTPFTEGSES